MKQKVALITGDSRGAQATALLSEEDRWINAQPIEASGGMFL